MDCCLDNEDDIQLTTPRPARKRRGRPKLTEEARAKKARSAIPEDLQQLSLAFESASKQAIGTLFNTSEAIPLYLPLIDKFKAISEKIQSAISKSYLGFHALIIILQITLITSCSHVIKDGPPNYFVDETKVPNAIPKAEPLAKYGNMPFYRVSGKRYYTLKSSKNYDEIGTASWYGVKFHHQRTSSGEWYNMLGMTAAHKTLPLPTYVEVTNLKNHRKVIVKVNDRGPFATNRIIDLSYVAAKKLGMIGPGTTHVRVRAINPKATNQSLANNTESNTSFFKNWFSSNDAVYLQVGAFRERANALRLKHRLASILKAPIDISNLNERYSLYQVRVGPIYDVATAEKISHKLRRLGIKSNRI